MMKRLLVLATVATMAVLGAAGCSGDGGSSSGGGSGSTGGGSGSTSGGSGSTGGGTGSTGGGSGSTGGGSGSTGGGSGSTGGGSGSTGGGSGSTGGGSGSTGGGSGSTGGGSGSTGGGTGGSSGGGMGGGNAAYDAGWLDVAFGDAGSRVNDFGCSGGAAVDSLSALVYAGDAGLFAAGSGCTDTALAIMHLDENTGAPKSDIWDGGIFFLPSSQGTQKVVGATTMGNSLILTGVLDTGMGGPKAVGLLKLNFATGFIDTNYNAMSTITAGGATARASFAQGTSMVVVGDAVLDDGGTSGFVARFAPNGDLDTTFADAGVYFDYGAATASGGASLPNGLVVVGAAATATGSSATVNRVLDAGQPDITFGTNGQYKSSPSGADLFISAAVQPDGKVVVGGYSIPNLAQPTKAKSLVARLNSNGTLDSTFGTSGRVELDLVSGLEAVSQVSIDASGKVVAVVATEVSGQNANVYLLRFTGAGALDTTFGNGGGQSVPAVSAKLGMDFTGLPVMATTPGGYCLGTTTTDDDFRVTRFHE